MTYGGQAEAWTNYWRQAGPAGGCLPSAPRDVAVALQQFWTEVARPLPAGSRLVDLGCGAGAVAYLVSQANPGVEVTGVDYSHVPPSRTSNVVLLSGVEMESLPFENASFDSAASQFGIEYSDLPTAAGELARVLRPDAPLAFAVHHASSPIIAHNRRRCRALEALTAEEVGSAFVSGERSALGRALTPLLGSYSDQDVIAEFSTGLGEAIAIAPAERRALWADLTEKIANERATLRALEGAAVEDIAGWLAAFGRSFAFESALTISDSRGASFAWAVTGKRL